VNDCFTVSPNKSGRSADYLFPPLCSLRSLLFFFFFPLTQSTKVRVSASRLGSYTHDQCGQHKLIAIFPTLTDDPTGPFCMRRLSRHFSFCSVSVLFRPPPLMGVIWHFTFTYVFSLSLPFFILAVFLNKLAGGSSLLQTTTRQLAFLSASPS